MKLKFLCYLVFILICGSACSKEQVIGVMDDVARDTYEKKVKEERIESLGDPTYEEPPTYDQYQRERKKLLSKQEESTSEVENEK